MNLRHRCLIERPGTTQDATYGTTGATWSTVATVWANVQDVLPSRSTETVHAGLANAASRTRVRMRFRTDLDSSMRFTIARPTSTVYQVVAGPAEIGNRKYIEFVVEAFKS